MKIASKILLISLFSFASFSYGISTETPFDAEVQLVAANSKRKSKKKKPAPAEEEEEVDLSAMETAPVATSAQEQVNSNPHGSAGTEPHFSVFFDLLAAYRPNRENFSFLNFHPLLFFEIVPNPDVVFSFEVNPSPRYFELDYNLSKSVTLRVGKIWIPFDDLNPHNLFGGMVGTARMAFGSTAYLPDIWADLGIGLKWIATDSKSLKLESHLYVVNGFGADSNDTAPTFGTVSSQDNNDAKSLGGKLHFLIAKTLGVGFSVHAGRWGNQNGNRSGLLGFGSDIQLRLASTEIKLGASTFNVDVLGGGSFNRLASYAEVHQKFGKNQQFRIFARAGTLDTDDRVVDDSDNIIVGGGIRWRPNVITLSLERYQDLKTVEGKRSYDLTFLRAVVQL